MKQNHLMTKDLRKRFKKVGRQDTDDPIIIAKFFNPCGPGTWYLSEYDEEENIGFGYVTGLWSDEWGNVSIVELEGLECQPLGLPIERDLYFSEKPFSQLKLQ